MQTFLPYRSFVQSAKVLDNKRLGKQRVEAYQILQILSGDKDSRWRNHPAVKMWKGYELMLAEYGLDITNEWKKRGYRDSLFEKFVEYVCRFGYQALDGRDTSPPWLGKREFHSSHRSNLLRKKPEWYGKFRWKETPDKPYFWPTKQ